MKKLRSLSIISVLMLLITTFVCGCSENENKEKIKQYYNYKIAIYETENLNYIAGEVDAVFLGDSLTDGYDLNKFYPEYNVLNRGISGDTTIGLENRLKVSVYDVQPKVALMLIGGNNMDTMMNNYEQILIGFKDNLPNTEIILLSLTSMSGEWGKKNQLAAYNNVKIKMLAERYGYYFVDLYSALLNLETGEIYAEYTTDGGHLTDLGYQVLTREIKPMLKLALHE